MSKRDTSTQRMGNATNSSSVFKPLIASSLALALGVSVASATFNLTGTDLNTDNFVGIYVDSGAQTFTTSDQQVSFTNHVDQNGSQSTESSAYAIVARGGTATINFGTSTKNISISGILTRWNTNASKTILNIQADDAVLNIGKLRTDGNSGKDQSTDINFTGVNANLQSILFNDAAIAGGVSNITFSGNGNNMISNGLVLNAAGTTNYVKFNNGINVINGGVSTSKGESNIISSSSAKSTQINGDIKTLGSGGSAAKTSIALSGTTAQIGSEDAKINLGIDKNGGWAQIKTLVMLNADTNKVYLEKMNASGYYSEATNNLNVLSFNAQTGNTLGVTTVYATNGINVIGGNYLEADSSKNNAAKVVSSADLSSDYAANISSVTIGTIKADSKGTNAINISGMLNVDKILVTHATTTASGANYIHVGSLEAESINSETQKGAIVAGDNHITVDNDAHIVSLASSGAGSITGGTNYITVNGRLTLDAISATAGGTNSVYAKILVDNSSGGSANVFSTVGGNNLLSIGDGNVEVSFVKSLSVQSDGGYGAKNTVLLKGTSATLGSRSVAVNLSIQKYDTGSFDAAEQNLVLLKGTDSNAAYINNMNVSGNYASKSKNFNIISLADSTSTILNLASMSAAEGSNIIGKDYLVEDTTSKQAVLNIKKTTKADTVDTTNSMFDSNGAIISANLLDQTKAKAYAANIDTLTMSGDIVSGGNGLNLINMTGTLNAKNIKVTHALTNASGMNIIYAGTLNADSIQSITQNGAIAAGDNHVYISGDAHIASLVSSGAGSQAGGTNYVIVEDNLTLDSVSATAGGTNIIKAKTLTDNSSGGSASVFSTVGGNNKMIIGDGSDIVSFVKSLAVQADGGYNAMNALEMKGTDVSLGDLDKQINISMTRYGEGNFGSSANNLVMLNGSSSNNAYIEKMSASGNYGIEVASKNFNILSLDGSATENSVNINSMDALFASNIIGKGFLDTDASGNSITFKSGTFTDGKLVATTNDLMSDTYAMSGVLHIASGISAGQSAQNIISYVATSSATSTIIDANDKGVAISGPATVYLNMTNSNLTAGVGAIQAFVNSNHSSTAQQTLMDAAVIAGNIVATNDGNTNIKIIGKSGATTSEATTNVKMGMLGNIINGSNKAINIVMQDAFFAPSQMQLTDGSMLAIGGNQAGKITTTSGTTNIVTRFTDKSPTPTGISMYNVDNSGSGTTNIVLQGDYTLGANVNYSGTGAINMIFASSNLSVDDSRTATDDFSINNNISQGQVLGETYTNGLLFTLKDIKINVGDQKNVSFVSTYGDIFRSENGGNLGSFKLGRNDTGDVLKIEGLMLGTIAPLQNSTAKHYTVNMASGSAYIGSVALTAGSRVSMIMDQGSKLLTNNSVFYVGNLKLDSGNTFSKDSLSLNTFAQSNTIIDLATMGSDLGNVETRNNFRLFAVGVDGTTTSYSADTGLQGENALFRVYVNNNANQTDSSTKLGGYAVSDTNGKFYSDRVVIADIGANTDTVTQASTQYIQVVLDNNTKLGDIHFTTAQSGDKGGTALEGNIAVATVKNGANITSNATKALVNFVAQDTLQGFDQIGASLVAVETDNYGIVGNANKGWTTYFVDSVRSKGATEERAEVSAIALATNYDLYMANFNSLNKRMGELRNNDNSQGVWARVFNGSQTNDFGLGTKTSYTTFQGGYDYAFGFEGANNYLGVAVSYGMSSSEVQNITQTVDQSVIGLDNVKSSAVEVAIYNSYVQDEGWYNDSIFKFSYIMSDFNLLGQETNYSMNNMAFTLSDEFGYRFKLGGNKEWFIDPQAEVALGYFDQSNLKQTLGLASLDTTADSVMTIRSRFGSSFGYDFKNFTEGKAIQASVYVGAFYEYDYVTGGDVTLTTNLGTTTNTSSAISSDGRVVMNVGTNMTIKDNTRIYFDFEKSFAGKINTDYQVNVGVRYSFGENASYVPESGAKKEVAPLKVSDENAEATQTTEESKESVETQESAKENTSNSQEQQENSTDKTQEEKKAE